jgi:Flp pilus assembly protein TadG
MTSRRKTGQGQVIVEFAVRLPLRMLLVLGLMTFGIALNQYLTLTRFSDWTI